ncbi:hypothetical protein ACFL03_13940 [Thermodesulfobacteriota bacterium]
MWKNRKTWSFFLFVVLFLASLSFAQKVEAEEAFLFTAKEAERLRHAEGEWEIIQLTRAPSSGPRVVIQHPEVKGTEDDPLIETVSPVGLFVSFEENLAPVDMGSLKIKAKKGFLSQSLTERLRPFIKGTDIEANGIKVPSGRFIIQITISDSNGEKTLASYRLSVKDHD